MLRIDQMLPRYDVDTNGGLRSFSVSLLGKMQQMLLPHCGLVIQQALCPQNGFVFNGDVWSGRTDPESRNTLYAQQLTGTQQQCKAMRKEDAQ